MFAKNFTFFCFFNVFEHFSSRNISEFCCDLNVILVDFFEEQELTYSAICVMLLFLSAVFYQLLLYYLCIGYICCS